MELKLLYLLPQQRNQIISSNLHQSLFIKTSLLLSTVPSWKLENKMAGLLLVLLLALFPSLRGGIFNRHWTELAKRRVHMFNESPCIQKKDESTCLTSPPVYRRKTSPHVERVPLYTEERLVHMFNESPCIQKKDEPTCLTSLLVYRRNLKTGLTDASMLLANNNLKLAIHISSWA